MQKVNTALYIIRNKGITAFFKIVTTRLFSKKISNYDTIKKALKGKYGLEIGGPSTIFQDYNFIPVYKIINCLDCCNFSESTIWEGAIKNGDPFKFYKNKNGIQYVADAINLSHIPESKYEFVISSHCLEHIANPMKAFEEWLRVLKKDGYILIIVPNKEKIFDHKRNVTSFDHLLHDYKNNIGEDDLTHLDEILELHDLSMDINAGDYESFKQRSLKNYENRTLHHHVFDLALLKEIFLYLNLKVLMVITENAHHIILGQKDNENNLLL